MKWKDKFAKAEKGLMRADDIDPPREVWQVITDRGMTTLSKIHSDDAERGDQNAFFDKLSDAKRYALHYLKYEIMDLTNARKHVKGVRE
jgi:hypothetical protein